MRLTRGGWVAFVLAPLAMAQAADARADEAQALPHGVRFVDGRYSMDVCDHDDAGYCLAHRLLPDSWRPGDDTSPDVGPFAGGPASDVDVPGGRPR